MMPVNPPSPMGVKLKMKTPFKLPVEIVTGVRAGLHEAIILEAGETATAARSILFQGDKESAEFIAAAINTAKTPTFDEIEKDDAMLTAIGRELAKQLNLRAPKFQPDRIYTESGPKTHLGLARTVLGLIQDTAFAQRKEGN
jgi:hypothetical protein